jgi:hypothetical protein
MVDHHVIDRRIKEEEQQEERRLKEVLVAVLALSEDEHRSFVAKITKIYNETLRCPARISR